ncbi:hypothetical protein CDO26_07075 [Sinorhizobium meliloti]|uniref:hypothetical protein n=1 Tax=Rhizobium meliloti TaxID=382 RepID=UPI000B4A0231|nr:hypothetical protein [Sinorhizobium meliloti]ASP84384.1 hypothetical protein CDO26_07075 [Sinorhizobium meliloti]MQW28621.1 hypothetical protein [Sinorhizobium meliloti]
MTNEVRLLYLAATGALSQLPQPGGDPEKHEKEYANYWSAADAALEQFAELTDAVIEEVPDGHQMTLCGVSAISTNGRANLLSRWKRAAEELIMKEG